jgi:hypothetical protein
MILAILLHGDTLDVSICVTFFWSRVDSPGKDFLMFCLLKKKIRLALRVLGAESKKEE